MYQLTPTQINQLIETNNLLNQLEIKGRNNVAIMYTVMATLQQILQQLQQQEKGVVINNTQKEV